MPLEDAMKRAVQLWLFTTTLTLLAIMILIIVAALSLAYLPASLFTVVLVTVGAALSVGIASVVRKLLRN